MLNLDTAYLQCHPLFRNPSERTKRAIMLHTTRMPGVRASSISAWCNTQTSKYGPEFICDNDGVIQLLPIGHHGDCIKSWHAGIGPNGSANDTHIGFVLCEPIQSQLLSESNFHTQSIDCECPRRYSTYRIQMELSARGYYIGNIDGEYGLQTEAAVINFQRAHDLFPTGVVDKKTLSVLSSRFHVNTLSYTTYDTDGAQNFFNNCYDNAVATCAWLCMLLDISPCSIISHHEGYQRGIASNIIDVEFLFGAHGKSMSDFRDDVSKAYTRSYIPLSATHQSNYMKSVNILIAHNIIGEKVHWHSIDTLDTEIDANIVMALFRQTAQYFCKKSYIYALTPISERLPELRADYFSPMPNNVPLFHVMTLLLAIAKPEDKNCIYDAIASSRYTMSLYSMGLDLLRNNGVISQFLFDNLNSYNTGINTTNSNISRNDVMQLISEIGAHLCSESYRLSVHTLADILGIHDMDYWMRGSGYTAESVRALIEAIASAIQMR